MEYNIIQARVCKYLRGRRSPHLCLGGCASFDTIKVLLVRLL